MSVGIYAYLGTADDFDCMGLVGELIPTECIHEEIAGGMSELTLTHPVDDLGRWKALIRGNIVKAPVPVRTTPEIDMSNPDAPKRVTTVEIWTVAAGAPKADRYLMTKASGGKKKKLLAAGLKVTFVGRGSARHKVKCKFGMGYVKTSALIYSVQQTVPDTNTGIEQAQPAWKVTDQLFRIYKVKRDMDSVVVSARHIFYDVMGNITTYSATSCTAGAALQGIIGNCMTPHDFNVYTDMGDVRYALNWERINPVKALLDQESGFISRWNAQLVRDDFDIFLLRKAGMNRGVTVEYTKNMLGMQTA